MWTSLPCLWVFSNCAFYKYVFAWQKTADRGSTERQQDERRESLHKAYFKLFHPKSNQNCEYHRAACATLNTLICTLHSHTFVLWGKAPLCLLVCRPLPALTHQTSQAAASYISNRFRISEPHSSNLLLIHAHISTVTRWLHRFTHTSINLVTLAHVLLIVCHHR